MKPIGDGPAPLSCAIFNGSLPRNCIDFFGSGIKLSPINL